MAGKRRVTIKQVAQEAGVSTQTVSRVLNERPDVAPETRQRVKDVIARLGYQPSALARSLIQQRSFTLGVVTAGLKYLGPSRTLNGITGQAEDMGYTLMLKELPGFASNDIKPLLDSLLARQVDGIIWAVPEVGDNRGWLKERCPEIPIPVIFLTMQARSGLSSISIDNFSGGKMATEHILQQGFHHVAHISGPLDWWEARQRQAGWQAALSDAGIDVKETHSVEGNWSPASGERAFQQLLKEYPQMDALFVANDQMALSVLQFAHREGIRVPDELAVVGFDGIPEAAYFWPPLTTVYQDQHKLGSQAVHDLIQIIEKNQEGTTDFLLQATLLQPELIVRDSSHMR
jgi:LacI family transcriptional regulator